MGSDIWRYGSAHVARAGTNIEVLIRRNLDAVGRTEDTALTAFTDGCPGLRRALADVGVARGSSTGFVSPYRNSS